MAEVRLMKGNEALAHSATLDGLNGYFGYSITPRSRVLGTLVSLRPWERTGMVVLQAESEVSSINTVYGGAGTGKRVTISFSSPSISLMSEGISYIAGAELPTLIVNVMRGDPGPGTIQPSQTGCFQTIKGDGHDDYRLIVLAPYSVQEMVDFVDLGIDLAFRYRNPVVMFSGGIIGQIMEKVVLPDQEPRHTDKEIVASCPWAATGHTPDKRAIITSLGLDSAVVKQNNLYFQEKCRKIEENEIRYKGTMTEDADYVLVAFGSSIRICQKVVQVARQEDLKVGLICSITLWPYPYEVISKLTERGVKGLFSVGLNVDQMVEDTKLAVNGRCPVEYFGRMSDMLFSPDEILNALHTKLVK